MTFQERYQYNPNVDLLGKGGFARVYKATDRLLDREVAIKVFNAVDKGQYTVLEEIKKAIRLHHPNLLRYYDVAVVESTNALGETDTLQIGVMELANAGDLKKFARNNPGSPILKDLLLQVLSGLEYLHIKGLIHRDMKPLNILLTEEGGILSAKISDFGISKNVESSTNSASMAIGTIEYMAPEQFNPQKYGINGKIGTNADLWSFGIMLYELLADKPLFGQRNGNTTAEQIMNSILSQVLPPGIDSLPEPYRSVVKRCLVTNAQERVKSAAELITILKQGDQHRQEDSSFETVQFDRASLHSILADSDNETVAIPRATFAAEENPVSSEYDEDETEVRKMPVLKFAIPGLLIVAALAYWIWPGGKSLHPQAIEQYRKALEHSELPAVYVTHLERSAAFGYDSAQWRLARYFVRNGKIKEAAPYIEKLINQKRSGETKIWPDLAPMQAQMLIEVQNKKDEGLAILQTCAAEGNIECEYLVGMLYYEGKIKKQDYKQAIQWFERAATKNDDKAQTMLGNMQVMGLGTEQNNSAAIENYFKAADRGNSVAMYALGLAYTHGTGVEQNKNEAKKWFQKVINLNNNAQVTTAAKQQIKNTN